MKIMILTLPLHSNYGGILQAYALQQVLLRMGYDVETINWHQFYGMTSIDKLRRIGSFIKCLVRKYILHVPNVHLSNPLGTDYRPFYPEVEIDKFIKMHIRTSRKMQNLDDLRTYIASHTADAYIVGSDQVWREEYSPHITTYFLDFLPDDSQVKRIAYAASFGVGTGFISVEKLPVCQKLLCKFDAISVREYSAVDIVYNTFGCKAVQVLDPTLLLTADDYCKLIDKANYSVSKGLTTYILDSNEDKDRIVAELSKVSSFKSIKCLSLDASQNEKVKGVLWSISEWLSSIYNADFVVTDSFHGCVFSIMFHKPFVAIANKERGLDRFISLLTPLGLEHCLVFSYDDFHRKLSQLLQPIDYNSISEKLDEARRHSMKFLADALSCTDGSK